ncbi:MAG: diadenylate cyclase CdaA [Phycisphaerales bacterium]
MLDRLAQLLNRFSEYPLWEVAIEVAIIWVIVYLAYRFVRGTRAAGALKGLLVLLVLSTLLVRVLDQAELLGRISALYDTFLSLVAIALIVTFQPELRRALIRLGEASLFRQSEKQVIPTVDAVVTACRLLSKNKFGAILALERNVGLRELIESGRALNADVSAPLITTIFWPNSPLHDMGVVIRNNKIVAAAVQFPLAEAADMPSGHLGTRHRAAVGLARTTDALVVVVSEETGAISIADGRELRRWLSPEELHKELIARLRQTPGRMSDAARGEEQGASGDSDNSDDDDDPPTGGFRSEVSQIDEADELEATLIDGGSNDDAAGPSRAPGKGGARG